MSATQVGMLATFVCILVAILFASFVAILLHSITGALV